MSDPADRNDAAALEAALIANGWKTIRGSGFAQTAGPIWTRRTEDGRDFGVFTGPAHLNAAGIVHGGLLTTLLDQAVSAVAWEAAGRKPCVTVQLDSQFVAAVQPGNFVIARGSLVQRTRTLAFVRGELRVGDAVVVTGSAVMRILE